MTGGEVEIGSCDLCGQEMLRTENDCWHPWTVAKACPPELLTEAYGVPYPAFGDGFSRPGREHFVPAASRVRQVGA